MARKSRKNPVVDVTPTIERKTAFYLRLSREDVKKIGDSIENQKKICQQHLLSLPELGTAVIYEDNGFSGQNTNRPDFQRLLSDVENGLISCIIVKDLSRLGRNSLQTGYYLDRVFPLNEVRFIAVTDCYDSLTDQGDILIPIKNMLNEAHAIECGKKVSAAKQQIIANGGFAGSIPPYGYKKQEGNCRQLEIDEVSSKVVLEMYELKAQGSSLSSIARKLNQRGELTSSEYEQVKQGKEISSENKKYWVSTMVKRYLTSIVYLGHLESGKYINVNQVTTYNDPEKIICTKNTHEPIVSEELFEKVQEQLSLGSVDYSKRTGEPHLFIKKVTCGVCGKIMNRRRAKTKKGFTHSYRCDTAYKFGSSCCPSDSKINFLESKLQQILFIALNKQAEVLLGKNLILAKKEIELDSVKENSVRKQKELEKKISKSQKFLKSLYENLVTNVISDEEYKQLKAEYENDVKSAKTEYLKITETANKLIYEMKLLNELSTEISNPDLVITKELVDKTVDKIIAYSKDKVEIRFSFHFPTIDEVIDNE